MQVSDLNMLVIDRVIVHKIPERRSKAAVAKAGGDTAPEFSGAPSPLTDDMARYLEERLVESLREQGFPVREKADTESETREAVRQLLGDTAVDAASFVQLSQAMAEELHSKQSVQSNKGLFALMEGQVGAARTQFVAVMKFEEEKGVRLELVDSAGQQTWQIVLEDSLMLTQKTKVFKVGLFSQQSESSATDDDGGEDNDADNVESITLDGLVSDMQTGFGYNQVVADFFLRKYLGFELVDIPSVRTKQALEVIERWSNSAISAPETRLQYEDALLSEMRSAKKTFSLTSFRDDHVEKTDRNSFDAYMKDSGVPLQRFKKDLGLVESRLKKIVVEMEDDIKIVARHDAMTDGALNVDTADDDRNRSTVTVIGKVKKVHGGGR